MALRRKDQTASKTPGAGVGAGRPLIVYFLPSVVIGILILLLLAVFAQHSIDRAAADAAHDSMRAVAQSLASRLEGAIVARRDLLSLAIADGRGASALAGRDDDAIQKVEAEVQRSLPGMLQLRLLPNDASQPDPGGVAPLGYAGLDMLRQVAESRRPSSAEIHQIKSGAPYLALAAPLVSDGRVVGVAFSAWDVRPIQAIVNQAAEITGSMALLQGGIDGFVIAQSGKRYEASPDASGVDVPETIWRLMYAIQPEAYGADGLVHLLTIAGGGALVLLLVTLLQWRILAGDLRGDMATIVNLGETLLQRGSTGARGANVSTVRDTIALMGQYVRAAHGGGSTGPAVAAAPRQPAPAPAAVGRAPQGMEVEELDHDPSEVLGGGAPPATGVDVPAELFRAYDVRGIVGESLDEAFAKVLGRAVGSLIVEQGGTRVAVGCDSRLSSPALTDALIAGIVASGCAVLDIGQVPTPLLYFALQTRPVQGGVMVTGSHNPSDYNGFKIVVGDRVLDGEDLQALRQRIVDGAFRSGKGTVERVRIDDEYIEAVTGEVQLTRPLRVVVDGGNGAAGQLALATLEGLGCEVLPLFCEPDGNFPNHHPDPSQPENLASLILEVQAQEADLGIALDGDGDRLGLVDDSGVIVWPDKILMLLAADVLGRHPGVDILYDVKSSRHLASFILSHGGRPIMWQSGHSRMRAKMLETGALLGGEFSGHVFIKERWFGFDDAIYTAVRVIEILALESRRASEMFDELPSSPATPEYQLLLEEGRSVEIMRALDAHKVFDNARLVELDGLRVEFANGWGLIRPSNTIPSLTFRFEADDEDALSQIKAQFRELLRRVAPDVQAPF
ncbi:MAG: phosphomannomutase/phosphoglucomutase [Chromatiaceae bacterium]|nr:phosphomannomutase/phosphoglucomutase [Chromatiaceae bacterium]MCP5422162.1 phosphomannomutase/phosphoglucomutase [Chromatiaceae bacterium]